MADGNENLIRKVFEPRDAAEILGIPLLNVTDRDNVT